MVDIDAAERHYEYLRLLDPVRCGELRMLLEEILLAAFADVDYTQEAHELMAMYEGLPQRLRVHEAPAEDDVILGLSRGETGGEDVLD